MPPPHRSTTSPGPGEILLGLLLLLPGHALRAAPPDPPVARRSPAHEALFPRPEGWTGGDGVYSLGLDARTVLWLFGDTFLARVEQGARVGGTLVNNSVGLQRGLDPTRARLEYSWGTLPDGKPTALFRPPEPGHWYWPLDAARVGSRLLLFQALITSTGEASAFGFRRVGTRLVEVADPSPPPREWETVVHDLPFGGPQEDGETYFGSGVLDWRGWLYVYGYRDRRVEGASVRELVVSRVPRQAATDPTAWRFHTAEGWTRDWRRATALAQPAATEFSVVALESGRLFALVLTPGGLSEELVLRTARSPLGPFSEPLLLYRCPDMGREEGLFCYAGKAHPALSRQGHELFASYVVNASDFWRLARDAEIYLPRFVRLDLERVALPEPP